MLTTARLLLPPLTRADAVAVVAGDRAGRAWSPGYPTAGDLVVAGLLVATGRGYRLVTVKVSRRPLTSTRHWVTPAYLVWPLRTKEWFGATRVRFAAIHVP